jgi:hypothetical protein
MDLNHRSTGYEPVGRTMLTYPASKPSATVTTLEPTDTISRTWYGGFLNKDLLWYSNEDEFASNGRDPDSALR